MIEKTSRSRVLGGEDGEVGAGQVAVDAQDGRLAHAQVQVGAFALDQHLQQFVQFSHKCPLKRDGMVWRTATLYRQVY